jgi:hypothetical protein
MANNNYNNNNQGSRAPKRSGATYTMMKTNGPYDGHWAVNAWCFLNGVLVTASAFPVFEKTKDILGVKTSSTQVKVHYGNEKGNEFVRYAVTLTQGIQTAKYFTIMNLKTKKLYIQELGMFISPNGSGTTKKGKNVTGTFAKLKKR